MGATRTPLTIVVLPPLDTWPEVEALRAQGHTVLVGDYGELGVSPGELSRADLVMGPQCWLMNEALRKYFPLAVKSAQRLLAKSAPKAKA